VGGRLDEPRLRGDAPQAALRRLLDELSLRAAELRERDAIAFAQRFVTDEAQALARERTLLLREHGFEAGQFMPDQQAGQIVRLLLARKLSRETERARTEDRGEHARLVCSRSAPNTSPVMNV
jgi:hypothetical protein